MKNFSYVRPATLEDAFRALGGEGRRDVLAGGTTMVDLLKIGVVAPDALVDITGIEALDGHEVGSERIRFGALARMSDVGDDETLSAACPALTNRPELFAIERARPFKDKRIVERAEG